MFINDALKTKLVFWRKSTNIRTTSTRSAGDINPVVDSDAPTFTNAMSLPLSSKARKLRLFSTLTHSKKTSLASVFEKGHDDVDQISSTLVPRTTSATLEPSGHVTVTDVLEDGCLPVTSTSAHRWECSTEFGLLPPAMGESSSNREDSLLDPDPPGSRTAFRVASLRMRTAAVWASIPSTMDGVPISGEYDEPSTPVKFRVDASQRNENINMDRAMAHSPSFSSPATSVTAVSECGLRDHALVKLGIDHKPEWPCITSNPLSAAALDDISLGQSPGFPAVVTQYPPGRLWTTGRLNYDLSNTPESGRESSDILLEEYAEQQADDPPDPSPAGHHFPLTLSNTVVCANAANPPRSLSPDLHSFTNSDEALTPSDIHGSPSPFQRLHAAEFSNRPWSCAKITRAKTKRASRRDLLEKRGFFTRISRVLKAGSQKHPVPPIEIYARVARSSALESTVTIL